MKQEYANANTPAFAAGQGASIAGYEQEDLNSPLLQPVNGISFRDYAAMTIKLSSGTVPEDIYQAMNCSEAAYAGAAKIWIERLQGDTTGKMAQLYGKYYAEADKHPILQNLATSLSAMGQANLTKLKTDRYYYYELEGAKDAVKEAGRDENEWILEKFGIPHTEFQMIFAQWLTFQNQHWDMEEMTKLVTHRQEKQREYAAKIAAGQI